MKVNVVVMSRKQFEEYAAKRHNHTSAVISISSFRDKMVSEELIRNPYNNIQTVYRAVFDDVDTADTGMNAIQAIEMADFIKMYISKVDKVIVHCGAGQSRSAGIAAAILKFFTGDDSQIFNDRRFTPNMRCYRLMLEALMLG